MMTLYYTRKIKEKIFMYKTRKKESGEKGC